jgi:hypothetical protein
LLTGISLPMLSGGNHAPTAQSAALAVPVDSVKVSAADETPATLAELMAKGEFIPPLQGKDQVGLGTLALHLDRKTGPAWPLDTRDHFSHSDGQMIVFVNWDPQVKFKGTTTLRLYDLDNKLIGQAQPLKVSAGPGGHSLVSSSWTVPLATLPSGLYRADVSLGDAPVWREFFVVLP